MSIQSQAVSELCDGLYWRLSMLQDADYSSRSTFGKTIANLTGIGAIYNMGSDKANLDRSARSVDWIRHLKPRLPQDPSIQSLADRSEQLFQNEAGKSSDSILLKIAYLGLGAIAITAYLTDATRMQMAGSLGAFGLAAYFVGKAGYDALDRSPEMRIAHLEGQISQIAIQPQKR
jgi:hypothetical protein